MSDERATTAVSEDENGGASEGATDQEQLAAGLKHLLDLLEWDRVEEARRFVKELEKRWPDAERVRHYAHVLAPPVARRRPDIPARSRDKEWKWLEEHGREHPGCWLALYEDRLLAADPDRSVVRTKAVEALGEGEETYLLIWQPRSREA